MDITLDISSMINAILWPLIVLILLLVYRENIISILPNIRKLKLPIVEIEFGIVKELSQAWLTSGSVDLRRSAQPVDIADNIQKNFINQLRDPSSGDYAIVDLGIGNEWLTSRLFILAILFERMKGLKSFVFVETVQDIRRKYIGWAEPSRIRWSLAKRYSWMEEAFSKAYNDIIDITIVSSQGRLGKGQTPDDPSPAIELLMKFLERIQNVNLLPSDGREWVTLESEWGNRYQEHAQWLDGKIIEELLGENLNRSYILSSNLEDKGESEQLKTVLSRSGNYVAVTRDDGRFEKLIDRQLLLEEVAKSLVKEK